MLTRILASASQRYLCRMMSSSGVDKYGIKIMSPKPAAFIIKLSGIPSVTANIIKQELLGLGADAAVSRDALTGAKKNTDCLLMGNLLQYRRLCLKLKVQPFGLKAVSAEIDLAINNFLKDNFTIKTARHSLSIRNRTLIMGIMNLTPDSFSGDGFYRSILKNDELKRTALESAQKMIQDGADILDIGGESSRPFSKPVTVKEELKRVIPILKHITRNLKCVVSIDTYKPEVASAAIDCGASLINDITALRSPKMRKLAARTRSGVVLMHMQGRPRTMQRKPLYPSLIDDVSVFLRSAAEAAMDAGVDKKSIIIDPGIGFGKTADDNYEILCHLRDFKHLGFPILVGPSRKSFIASAIKDVHASRTMGTAAAVSACVLNGASLLRVHDVKMMRQVIDTADRIRYARN